MKQANNQDFRNTVVVVGHLDGPGGQDESRQRRQVSWSAQVSGQQNVTHDDVAPEDVGKQFFMCV